MATSKRSPLAPQIATLAEQGVSIESNSWNGILARSGTPDAVVQRLNAEINKALQAPAVLQAFADGGIVSLATTPERFAAFIRSETDKYANVIRKSGITADT
jgi:tripartite-type tricarboxylate transporter receptor subunit TctC